MNNRLHIFLMIGLFFLFSCEKEVELLDPGQDSFFKVYGNGILDGVSNAAAGVLIDENGDFVVAGTTASFVDEQIVRGIYVFKTDPQGFLRDEILLTDTFPMIAKDIVKAGDGGYYVLGYKNKTVDLTKVEIQVYLARLTSSLTVEWVQDTVDLLAGEIEIPGSMTLSSDGNIVVMGNYIGTRNDSSAFVAAFNASGQLIKGYQYEIANSNLSFSRNILEGMFESRNSFVICFNEVRTSRMSPTLMTLDPVSLEIGPSPPFGTDNFAEKISEIRKYSADNYLMIGSTDNTTGNQQNILLYRISQLGELLWERIYGNDTDQDGGNASYAGNSICEAVNGGFIILGTKQIDDNNSDFYLVKTDGRGEVEWTKTLGGAGREVGVEIHSLDDGYLFLGTSSIAGTRLISLVKTDFEGNVIK